MSKYFIITVDTEGDNLWNYKKGESVGVANALYIPRFQDLCEKYGFKPVYLTNYEMAQSAIFVEYIKPRAVKGLCEIGIHVHAWNNPPMYNLGGKFKGNPYLVEYPNDIMFEKFKVTYDLITKRFGTPPVSHRAGRWVMDERYFDILEKFNIKVDCSHTPTVSWMKSPGETREYGCDYTNVEPIAHSIGRIYEVPMTIRKRRFPSLGGTLKSAIKQILRGKAIWMRPVSSSLREMKWLIRKSLKTCDYVEFMIHSSEVMPGGSPYFKTPEEVEKLYITMDRIFAYAKDHGYEGCTLEEYYNIKHANL